MSEAAENFNNILKGDAEFMSENFEQLDQEFEEGYRENIKQHKAEGEHKNYGFTEALRNVSESLLEAIGGQGEEYIELDVKLREQEGEHSGVLEKLKRELEEDTRKEVLKAEQHYFDGNMTEYEKDVLVEFIHACAVAKRHLITKKIIKNKARQELN